MFKVNLFMALVISTLSLESLAQCPQGHPQFPDENFRQTKESWPLYSWTTKPFDQTLPTLVFVNGGPGQSSHGSGWTLPDWNVIFWDQKGIGCSKPNESSVYYLTENYSVENTANDLKKILDLYNLQQVSILAVSYGTAPATVFAHQFPHHVKQLILEGTLFTGNRELQESSYRREKLMAYYEGLPFDVKQALQEWSKLPGLHPAWFSRIGYYFMALNDGFEKLDHFLLTLINHQRKNYFPSIDVEFLNNFGPQAFEDDQLGFSAVVFSIIACQEFSEGLTPRSNALQFSADTLIPIDDSPTAILCPRYGVQFKKSYEAIDYPLTIPVVYLQGEDDGATQSPFALDHYTQVAKGKAQFYLRRYGGHSPFTGEFLSKYPVSEEQKAHYQALFLDLLNTGKMTLTENDKILWTHKQKR